MNVLVCFYRCMHVCMYVCMLVDNLEIKSNQVSKSENLKNLENVNGKFMFVFLGVCMYVSGQSRNQVKSSLQICKTEKYGKY